MLFISKATFKHFLFDCISYPLRTFGYLLTSLGNDLNHVSRDQVSNMVAIHRDDPVTAGPSSSDNDIKETSSTPKYIDTNDGFITVIRRVKRTDLVMQKEGKEESSKGTMCKNYYEPLCARLAEDDNIPPNIIGLNVEEPDSYQNSTEWIRDH
jgi:hypothetical protein